MEYFNQDAESVIKELGSDRVNGLTEEQVKESREKYGENVLSEEKQKSIFMVFLEQFADLLVAILIAASIISMISGEVGSTIVILVVLIMNAILGTVQHVKAQRSLASLKAMSSPNARVIRGGVQTEIPASEVVVGDILLIEAGNIAAADGRLIEAASLQINESALTGESLNVNKSAETIDAQELSLAFIHKFCKGWNTPCKLNGSRICRVISRRQQHSAAQRVLRDDIALLQAH